jgi:uncharacterized membrane protein YeaQ/YmgE (transglycosylase-associated protein family)
MMVAAWLACGLLACAIAWSARAHAYPGGPATALAAGLCGGFLGGAFVILIAGRHGALPALSVYGAAVGAIVLLDLAERASGAASEPPRTAALEWLWSWAVMLEPLMLAAIVGLTFGAAAGSAPLGVLAGLASILLLYGHRNYGNLAVRRWRRDRW